MSKKLEEKQRRRLAEERRREELKKAHRRRNLVTAGIASLVAVGVVAAVIFQREQEEARISNVGVSENEADCGPIREHENQGNEHIPLGTPHEPYEGPAPSSGPHYAAPDGPVQGGFYDEPIPPEGPVHNLEHGQVVIWYSPEAPDDVIADIELITQQEELYTVAVPYSGLQSEGNFVLAAWTVTQECEQVSQAVVSEFRRSYQGKIGPEGELTPPFEG